MDVLMPKLSDTMEEGTLLQWLVAEGDEVSKGQVICEIETDKATMSFEAPAAGVISGLLAAGETVDVGERIATIGAATPNAPIADAPTADAPTAEPVKTADDEGATGIPTAADDTPDWIGDEVTPDQALPAAVVPAPVVASDTRGIAASPLARTRAAELGVGLAHVQGSGPGGRIVRADVEAAAGASAPPVVSPAPVASAPVASAPVASAPVASAPVAPAPVTTADGMITPLTRFERVAALRLTQAQLVPQYDVQRDIDVRALAHLRAELVQALPEIRPTVGDLILRAVALSAAARPDLLAQFTDEGRRVMPSVDVGVAVATEQGLLVPVLRGADSLAVADIARQVKDLAAAARAGTLRPDQMDGAAISVSNLGMFGVDRFRAILNPPEAAILAVGAIRDEPMVDNGHVVPGKRMSLVLTADHRVLDGARAAQLLGEIAGRLEHPAGLLL